MTDRIVDSDLNASDGTSTEEISSQLEGEKVTSEEVQESNSEQQSEEKVVPPKFQGKSVDEILQSYQNLEQQYGKQGNELGELRKLADSLIQKNLQEAQDTPVQEQEKRLSEDDFLANPVDSVRKIVEEAIQPIKGALQQTNTDTTMSRLQAKHPDVEAIVKDLDFQKWVMESVPRQDMWQKASAGDFNYADELFSQYKSLHGIKMEQQKEIARTEKERELNAATAVASGASQDAVSKGKPTYKRSELIRLQLEDPRRYADLQPEIYQAYKEGRVR
tara:strand:+ start:1694 stop:2521 length:828 start_codon:yes stop_codon:yes gene_type:complete